MDSFDHLKPVNEKLIISSNLRLEDWKKGGGIITSINPTKLDMPSFLLNPPFAYSIENANNQWMKDALEKGEYEELDRTLAMNQWFDLYSYLSSEAFVQLLPTPASMDWKNLQDLVYTANLGIVLTHLPDKNTVIISNFKSAPRYGETKVGADFFTSLGYNVFICPYHFEGEAELKHLYDNIYVGNYGVRSDIRAYEWMEEHFDMKIIKVAVQDEYLYHLDCAIFPILKEELVICTEKFTSGELKELESVVKLIDIPYEAAQAGLTNSVRLYNTILNASDIYDLRKGSTDYRIELEKNRILEDIAVELNMEVVTFNLSEFLKGGALLSCLVMHLNRNSYETDLI